MRALARYSRADSRAETRPEFGVFLAVSELLVDHGSEACRHQGLAFMPLKRGERGIRLTGLKGHKGTVHAAVVERGGKVQLA